MDLQPYLFWNNLSPQKSEPSSELQKAIESSFGTIEKFKELFTNAANTRFGSGWAWLVKPVTVNLKLPALQTRITR
ncbi:MAG: Fe-Mn family superoxide dismutase [Bacteroidales bacterium]